ncbi:MAG: S49 family peptidase, partial [Bryobacteraceae bacterium]
DTITGSIGVLYVRPTLHGLYDKLGIQEDMLTRGKLADMDSPYLPLSDAARQKLHDSIETTYKSFVSKVAAARKKSFDQIDPIAQGRVWMGAQATQNGLVDELGGLDRAIALVRKKANLAAGAETNLIVFPPRRSLLDILTNSSPDAFETAIGESKLRKALPGLSGLSSGLLPGAAFVRGGVLQILPYRLTVQ